MAKKKKNFFMNNPLFTLFLVFLIISVILAFTLRNSEEESNLTPFEEKYNKCLSACRGISDSEGNLIEGCHNLKISRSIPDIEFIIDYCNCLKTKSEEECLE